jgi:acetyl-CoA carboxylase biotin carboxylase subunit
MFTKVIVANRGAVASRVLRALNEMGIQSVALYSEADAGAPYLAMATETYAIGPAPARESYLNQDLIIEILRKSHADGLHPGYGFLSENAGFAQRVIDAGARFIGPSPKWIDAMGHKTRARELAALHGMPMSKGSPVLPMDNEAILKAARDIGYPVLVKPAGGGGGIGMLPAKDEAQLLETVERSRSMASRGFGNAEVYLERLFERPRHVEFQVLGDQHGNVAHLFERDCSTQRRNQKVIEEAPGPNIPRAKALEVAEHITGIMRKIGYDNIGTVEMLMGADGSFNFLEMNTRLQVEHGVTEEVTGVDLVQAQIRSAAGEKLSDILPAKIEVKGHAIQARVYAEDPKNFYPSPGKLNVFRPPVDGSVRVETGFAEGRDVTPHYDPMIAKVIAHADTRGAAIDKLIGALEAFEIQGLKHNIPAVIAILKSEPFRAGDVHTGLIPEVMKKKV